MNIRVILDLDNSNFKASYKGLTYVFSSECNKLKFENRIEDYIKQETLKIKSMYSQLNINFDLFLSIALYKKIEKRGFKIITDDNIDISKDTLFLIAYKQIGKHF